MEGKRKREENGDYSQSSCGIVCRTKHESVPAAFVLNFKHLVFVQSHSTCCGYMLAKMQENEHGIV